MLSFLARHLNRKSMIFAKATETSASSITCGSKGDYSELWQPCKYDTSGDD